MTKPTSPVHRRSAVETIWTVLGVLVCLPLVTVAMIVIHEIGHTLAAWAVGDWYAYFIVYRRVIEPSGAVDTCIGCNQYNSAKVGALANVFVSPCGGGSDRYRHVGGGSSAVARPAAAATVAAR